MILTCPECSTRYMAKPGTIDANGRSVRCARCQTVWFVEGVDADALALEDNKTVLIEAEPDPQAELPFVPDAPISPSGVGAHTRLRDKVDAERLSKRRRTIRLIWAVPLAFLVAAASAAFIKRQAIVDRFPATATLYQAVGFDVKANGLDVRNLRTEMLVVDGETILRVTGEVRNLLSTAQTAPLLQLSLENRSGESVADWFVDVGTIAAGGVSPIETDYPAPPVDGVLLRFNLVDG